MSNLMLRKFGLLVTALLIIGISAFIAGISAADSANLLDNSSVETADNTGSLPLNWKQDKWGNNTTNFTYKSDGGLTGSHSLYVNMTKRKSGDAKWYFNHLAVKPGQKYTYSENFKSNVKTEVDIEYINSEGKYSYVWLGSPAASSSDWKQVTYSFTTPSDVKSLTIFHLINRVGWLQTDEFSLTEGDGTPTPPQPTPPTVTITDPAANSTVSGIQSLKANADDAVGVAGVQFKIDGVNFGPEDNTAPYSISWDTSSTTNGSHTISATASNTGGLTTTNTETVNVQNSIPVAPTVSFSSPAANSTVSGTQNVAVNTSADAVGVQFKLDGKDLAAEDITAPYNFSWDTTTAGNGNHELSVVARNSAGLTATETETVNVQNIVNPPPVSTNLIANPSFEVTSNGTGPDSWQTSQWGTNTSTFSYLTSGHTGSHSVKTETTSYSNGAVNWYHNTVPVAAGKTYMYENWYQSNVSTEVDAEVTMSDGSTQYFWLGQVSPSSSWNKFSTTFTPPAGAKSMTVYHLLASKGYLISDDYSLEVYSPASFNRGLVSVTFDDGWASQYKNALPILNKYGLKATFYIISGELNDQPDYMSTAQIQNLYSQGMEIGSHTITHSDLTGVSQSKLVQEMSQSQATLQNAIGAPVVNFAYPYGAYNAETISVGQQYYQSQRTVNQGYNTEDNLDLTQLKIYEVDSDISTAQVQEWIQGAITQKSWLILVYHEVGTSIGGDIYHVSTANLDANMNYLKNSGVAVVTVNQAINEVLSQL